MSLSSVNDSTVHLKQNKMLLHLPGSSDGAMSPRDKTTASSKIRKTIVISLSGYQDDHIYTVTQTA